MRPRWSFLLVYACSGAAGLIYEIVWTRLLALQLGHTSAATGTVLAAFMGGLAVGALIGAFAAPRLDRTRALRIYGAVEVFIALCAVALPFALHACQPLLAGAYGDQPGFTFALLRVASSLALVFVPAAAMGATFPLAVHWFVVDHSAAGREAGGLYAANTVGAAVGALLTGFVLIPRIGLRSTTMVGIVLNAAAAGGAWRIATRPVVAASPERPRSRRPLAAPSARRRAPSVPWPVPRSLPAAVLGISGFAALVYEVTFTRAVALAIGPTTYAFAAMLMAVIAGLAIGSAVASRTTWTDNRAVLGLGLLMFATAAAASGAGWFTGTRLPLLVAEAVTDPTAGPVAILVREAFYAVAVLLPLSCALGAAFPLGVRLAVARDEAVARDVSVVYGVNTIGAVGGSLAGAFLLLPMFGLQQTLRVAGLLAIGAGGLVIVAGRLTFGRRAAGFAAAAIAGAVVFLLPGWDVNLLSSGGYKYAPDVRDLNLDLATGLKAGSLVYYKEGATATVSVRQLAGTIALAIDGKVDASNRTDMLTQKLLAHLPLLLHGRPHQVCIIGLGSGVTLGAALGHDIDRADVIEISPEVVEASSLFAEDNGHALADPRTRLLVTDGRSHLQLTSHAYDVIISEPSNPWMAGVSSLFTREFFQAARARLAPGGVICQWAHTYDIADADLRSIAATFASVFPSGTMWLIGDSDVLFIATIDREGPRLEHISRAWRPEVAADLAKASVLDAFSLLSLYVAGPRELQRYGQGAIIQTDDRMGLEFSGPLGVYDRRVRGNVPALQALLDAAQAPAAVRAAAASAGALEWRHRGQMLFNAHAYSTAFDAFSRSVQLDPESEPALTGLVDAAGSAQRVEEAQRVLTSLASVRPRDVTVRVALARLLAATGAFEPAVARAEEVVAAAPDNPHSLELLASIVADAGDLNRLRPLVVRMQQTRPDRADTWYYTALASFLAGRLPETISYAGKAVQIDPHHVLAHNLIGSAHARLGHRDEARQAFRAALDANPQESSTYSNLGLLELEAGNRDAAVAYFAESLTLDPRDEVARTNLPAALAGRKN